MMKLETMARDTLPLAKEALKLWPLESGETDFFRASANFIWGFQAGDDRIFLRLSSRDERSHCQVQAELAFITWLAGQGMSVSVPFPSRSGRLTEKIFCHDQEYSAVVFPGVTGYSPEIGEMSSDQLFAWGRALGQLHNLSQGYIPLGQPRWSWRDQLNWVEEVISDLGPEPEAHGELARVRTWLQSLSQSPQDFGLIHYDFESDNLLWQPENGWTIIDFDDSVYHWYVMDVVAALRDLDKLEAPQAEQAYTLFIQGYQSVRPLNQELLEQQHFFRRAHTLLLYARVARSISGQINNEPEWSGQLRRRLEQTCAKMRQSMIRPWER